MTLTEARAIADSLFKPGQCDHCDDGPCDKCLKEDVSQAILEVHKAALESEAAKDLTAYARHSDFCSIGPGDCDCGYKSAVLRFEQFKEEAQK